MRVRDILNQKGDSVVTLKPQSSVGLAVKTLAKHNIGALVISRTGRSIDGIISERDIIRGMAKNGTEFLRWPVGDACFHKVQTCKPEDELATVSATMRKMRFRHLPVSDGGRLCGMISLVDILRAQLARTRI